MKFIFCILLPLFFIQKPIAGLHIKGEKYYYFCTSWSMKPDEGKGKQYILYADIKEITCEESYFMTLAHQWGDLVNSNCKNSDGCTSDVNSYHTLQEATNRFSKFKEKYNDTSRFIISKLDFPTLLSK